MRRPLLLTPVVLAGLLAASIGVVSLLPKRLFYRNRRPTRAGAIVNRLGAWWPALGLPPRWWVILETTGRRSGRRRSTTLVVGEHAGDEYLVSMLGDRSEWVRNVRAAGGRAVIRHGRRRLVRLEEVPAEARAPILKSYLRRAMGARPHFPIAYTANVDEFDRIAAGFPTFRIVEERGA